MVAYEEEKLQMKQTIFQMQERLNEIEAVDNETEANASGIPCT